MSSQPRSRTTEHHVNFQPAPASPDARTSPSYQPVSIQSNQTQAVNLSVSIVNSTWQTEVHHSAEVSLSPQIITQKQGHGPTLFASVPQGGRTTEKRTDGETNPDWDFETDTNRVSGTGQRSFTHSSSALQGISSAESPSYPSSIRQPGTSDSDDTAAQSPFKRRRIQGSQDQAVISPRLVPSNDGIPVQSPETHESATSTDQIAETAPSQISVPITEPLEIRKPSKLAKSKAERRIEQYADVTSADNVEDHQSYRHHQENPNSNPNPKTVKKPVKRRAQTNAEDLAVQIVSDAVQGSSIRKRRKSARAVTPEGAADVRIVPSEVKMAELCKNLRTGKKSAREKGLEQLERAKSIQKEQQQLQNLMGVAESTALNADPPETATDGLERLSRVQEEVVREVPNTIIVDGQIQIDETTLQLDRHAQAAVERDAEQLEGVDESELTRRVNAGSWLKRDKSGHWNEESTQLFFSGLRMFGTDFNMISKMFPGRTRRSIKLKFCKEEKKDKHRIKQTLLGEQVLVDMAEYERITKTTYADPKELEIGLEEDRRRLVEEQEAERRAMEEMEKEREKEVAASRAAAAATNKSLAAEGDEDQGGVERGNESIIKGGKGGRRRKGREKGSPGKRRQ